MNRPTALVITSISGPNEILAAGATGSQTHGVDFVVIGDTKSPADFDLDGCDFWSIERQGHLPFKLAQILPERHYARKNLGYLLAMERGAEVLIETDDDNLPLEKFWAPRQAHQTARSPSRDGWVNVYRYFSDENIWPRGFPLECLQQNHVELVPQEKSVYCPIQQGLADDNPDVDAVYRLILPLPIRFQNNPSIALGKGSWSPFNSQNTTWFTEAFPLLYIPYYCSFRMCDIWRSYVAMRICWENDWHVLFHAPTVIQDRNEHDLLHDFRDEIPGYLNNSQICDQLAQLSLKGGLKSLGSDLKSCYELLIELGHVGQEELGLIEAWIEDVSAILSGRDIKS